MFQGWLIWSFLHQQYGLAVEALSVVQRIECVIAKYDGAIKFDE